MQTISIFALIVVGISFVLAGRYDIRKTPHLSFLACGHSMHPSLILEIVGAMLALMAGISFLWIVK